MASIPRELLRNLHVSEEMGEAIITAPKGYRFSVAVLKGTVPYWVIALLPYVHEWAHASMNLQEPIRRPGPGNLVEITDDYWDRHCGIV